MNSAPVLIAGGGIGGLATALTLHQIGVPCRIFESVSDLRPLGVGINLQPNAVRELYELGLGDAELSSVGVRCREWALVGLNGNDIYSEPRGLEAGYRWPQYSVHRGEFHMLLYRTVQVLSARLRESDLQMIADLQRKNQQLARAYRELQAAQAAIVEKERLEHELDLARDLQQSILPNEFPQYPVATTYELLF